MLVKFNIQENLPTIQKNTRQIEMLSHSEKELLEQSYNYFQKANEETVDTKNILMQIILRKEISKNLSVRETLDKMILHLIQKYQLECPEQVEHLKDRLDIIRFLPSEYSHVQYLTEGQSGWFYVADHEGKKVCIKILPLNMRREEKIQKKFHQEVERAFLLDHPHFVRGIGQGILNFLGQKVPFYAMDFCSKGSLRDMLNSQKIIEKSKAFGIFQSIANALQYFHLSTQKKHKNFIPENILFDENDVLKIADFGLPEGEILERSPYYPEEDMAQDIDAREDVYMLGIIFMEMLTGQRADWKNRAEILNELREEQPLWKLCSGMVAEKKYRIPNMYEVLYTCKNMEHCKTGRFVTNIYSLQESYTTLKNSRTQEKKDEVSSLFSKILEILQTEKEYHLISKEIDIRRSNCPAYILSLELPSFLSILNPEQEKIFAKAFALSYAPWKDAVISYAPLSKPTDPIAKFLVRCFLSEPQDQNLCQSIEKKMQKTLWSEEETNILREIAIEKRVKDISVLVKTNRANPFVPAILELFQVSRESSMRIVCADTLGKIGDKEAIPLLVLGLKEADSDVARHCANALGRIGDTEAIAPLISCLENSPVNMQCTCIEALGRIGSQDAIPAILACLKNPNSNLRCTCARALEQIGDKKAGPGLIASLKNSSGYALRVCSEVLVTIYKDDILNLLASLKDFDTLALKACVEALAKLASKDTIPALLFCIAQSSQEDRIIYENFLVKIGRKELNMLISFLKFADVKYHYACIDALVKIGKDSISALVSVIQTSSDRQWIESCIMVLGRIGKEAVPALVSCLAHSDSQIRIASISTLGKIGDQTAAHALVPFLKESHRQPGIACVDALTEMGKEAVPVLISHLQDDDRHIRIACTEVLIKIGKEAIPDLFSCIQCADKNMCRACADALVEIGQESVLALEQGLNDADIYVRYTCKKALEKIYLKG